MFVMDKWDLVTFESKMNSKGISAYWNRIQTANYLVLKAILVLPPSWVSKTQ